MATARQNGVIKELGPDDRSWYKASEVALLLGIAESSAYRLIKTMRSDWIEEGLLPKYYNNIGAKIPKDMFDEAFHIKRKGRR